MQAVGTKNRTSLHSIDGSAFKTRGSLSIGRGGHVRKRRRGSLSFGISTLKVMRLLSASYKTAEKEKTGKSFDFPAVVDYTGKISNFLDDLEKLDRFAESIEDELLNLKPEK